MTANRKGNYTDAGFILPAVTAWFAGALVSLLPAAFILYRFDLGGGSVGYISSAMSFIAALAAGAAAGRARRSGTLYCAAVAAAVIVTMLLTVGFIIAGPDIQSSGVISVVSFTFAGCASGALIFGSAGNRRKSGPRP